MGPLNRLHHLHNGILSIAMSLSTDDVSCVCVDRCRSDSKESRQRTMMPRTRSKDGKGHVADTRQVTYKAYFCREISIDLYIEGKKSDNP